jgi:hypothetical protein
LYWPMAPDSWNWSRLPNNYVVYLTTSCRLRPLVPYFCAFLSLTTLVLYSQGNRARVKGYDIASPHDQLRGVRVKLMDWLSLLPQCLGIRHLERPLGAHNNG